MIRFFFHWLYTGTHAHESIKGYQNEKCMYFKYENESKKTPCNPLADPKCTCMAMTFACIFWTLLIQLDLLIWSDLEMKCTCIFAGDNFAGLKNWSRRKNKQVERGGGGLAYS